MTKSETNVELKDVKKYLLNDIDSFKLSLLMEFTVHFFTKTTHDGKDICVLSAALYKR